MGGTCTVFDAVKHPLEDILIVTTIPTLYQLIWYPAMPRKAQGWITFQASDEERQILDRVCQQTQRTKTEVLRELIRQIEQSCSAPRSTAREINSAEWYDDLEDAILTTDLANETEIFDQNTTQLHTLQISARNILKAKIKRVVKGTISAEVTLVIAPGVELVSIVTRTSADRLELSQGKDVFAVIKSSNVMIAAE